MKKAMILAAGLGTRLRPWTNNKPKALVKYQGKTLLQWTIEKLISFGYSQIIINIHHFAEQIIDFVKENDYFNIEIYFSDETAQLLDTGGGIKKAQWFFEDVNKFLVYNVDIFSDINLNQLSEAHSENVIATLAVQKRPTNRTLVFTKKEKKLCGWKNQLTGTEQLIKNCIDTEEFAFSGIHIISTKIFDFFPEGKFSIIKAYLDIAAKGEIITYYDHTGDQWMDLGLKENYKSN